MSDVPATFPASVLLATDLGPRSDRAFDRALQLARAWKARLVVLTVVDHAAEQAQDMLAGRPSPAWYRPLTPLATAERELSADARQDGVEIAVRLAEGEPGPAIVQIARAEGCGLIVVGVARHEILGRIALGSTADWLVRHSGVPVLVVRQRVRHAYRRLLAATDFSASSRHALETARTLFPQAETVLLHGFEVPYLGLSDGDRDETVAQVAARARREAEDFLAQTAVSANRLPAPLVVEHGDPARLARLYAEQYPVDLTVVGTHGRGAVFELLIGSTARRILESAATDTLVVRDPRAAGG